MLAQSVLVYELFQSRYNSIVFLQCSERDEFRKNLLKIQMLTLHEDYAFHIGPIAVA